MPLDLSRRKFLMATSGLLGGAAGVAALSCRSARRATPRGLSDLTANEAVAAMRKGEIKAEEYARALVDQAERLVTLNAFRTLDREAVLASAHEADRSRASGARLGLLHGLPVPVKDSVNTASLPTSNGTRALRDFRPKTNAAVLTPLLAQGAILMGKTSLHELSFGWTSHNLAFGAVHNPYDTAHVPGGSSGGSAVAVAARMAPLAIAEDTLGSIRIPATMCGLAGLRPSLGRYPDDGIMPLSDGTFDQVGPVARAVEDLVLFDTAITGDASPVTPRALAGVKIGVPDSFMADLDPEVERIATGAFERLRGAGVILVRAEVPEAVRQAMPVALTLITYETAAAIRRFLASEGTGVTFEQVLHQAGPNVRAVMEAIVLPPGRPSRAAYQSMLTQREQIRAAIRAHFSRHDLAVVAFPPAMIPPPRISDDSPDVTIRGHAVPRTTTMARNVSIGSCAGLSCLVLPVGLTFDGLPVGLEFDALPGTDRTLLGLGLSLERALGPVPGPRV